MEQSTVARSAAGQPSKIVGGLISFGCVPPWGAAVFLLAISGALAAGVLALPSANVLLRQGALSFAALAVWAGAIGWRRRAPAPVDFRWDPRIWNQAVAQSTILLYLGLYWPAARAHWWTIALQLAFCLAADALSNWRTRGLIQASASVLPMVLSINLFLWHDDAHFWETALILVLGVMSKTLWRWKNKPSYAHIFNPSAIALAAAGVVYYGLRHSAYIQLEEPLHLPPNMSEVILMVAFLVQAAYGTATQTLAAIVSMMAFNSALALAHIHYAPWPVEGQGFIGLTLLMTDPATSPRTVPGRVMSGALYGVLFTSFQVSFAYAFGTTFVYFSKIFAAPLANLAAPGLDARANRLFAGRAVRALSPAARFWERGAMAAVALLFLVLWSRPFKSQGFEEENRAEFKLKEGARFLRPSPDGRRVLCADNPVFCAPFSFSREIGLWAHGSR